MSQFDTIIMVDWSARSAPSAVRDSPDAIWIGISRGGPAECHYLRTRSAAMALVSDVLKAELGHNRRVLAGFDFPFGYPQGFAKAVAGSRDPLKLWGALAARIKDGPDNANNRFEVARELNQLFPGVGPFWGCPSGKGSADLPERGSARYGHGLPEKRQVETRVALAQTCWKLFTTGSVGSQALLGIPCLEMLRKRFGALLAVAPFEPPDAPIVLAEVFPSLLAKSIAARQATDEIKDRAQVRVVAETLSNLPSARLTAMLKEGDPEEGWILGAGHQEELIAACP